MATDEQATMSRADAAAAMDLPAIINNHGQSTKI
jgi:hypothetical protein